MATNDERRWLAGNMRVFDVVADGRGRYWLNGTLFGMDVSARSEEGLRNGMAHFASFIEPDAIPDKPDETGRPLSEPEIDRERLLAIAELMAADSVRSVKKGSSVSPVYILHAARNIAEACGETFGSIRNRDLTKWGTSIVPKELVVDRDALLSLADEIDRKSDDGTVNPDPTKPIASSLDLFGYARRIREAVGA